jgi:hypothetical protein
MSSIDQDQQPSHEEPIRLVSLTTSLTNATKRNRLLQLAAKGEASLYVSVPPGKVAYAESLGIDRPRTILTNRFDRTRALTRHQASGGGPAITYPVAHPEIRFLKLKPIDAASLKAAGTVDVHWFSAGLKLQSTDAEDSEGWLVPYTFLPPFCLRSAELSGQESPFDLGLIIDAAPEHTLKIGSGDLYIDARIPAALMSGSPSPEVVDDPYGLVDRAPGVFVLYCAAKHFYGNEASPKGSRDEVMEWLQSQGEKKLYNKTVTGQLAKLIDPSYRRGSGVSEEEQQAFDEALIQSLGFSAKYKRDSITDALALILHVTDWWRDECAGNAKSKSPKSKATLRNTLHEKLEALGFYGKEELEAVRRVVMWPER